MVVLPLLLMKQLIPLMRGLSNRLWSFCVVGCQRSLIEKQGVNLNFLCWGLKDLQNPRNIMLIIDPRARRKDE